MMLRALIFVNCGKGLVKCKEQIKDRVTAMMKKFKSDIIKYELN